MLPDLKWMLTLNRFDLSWTSIYGLETVVSGLLTNTRTRWPHNEREIFNTARGVAECSIENFEFIVRPASEFICQQNTNEQTLTLLIYNLSTLHRTASDHRLKLQTEV